MPAKTKPKSKNTTRAKAKKPSKLRSIFNFSNSRGKMAVFLLSFAIVGGGYAAYSALAATGSFDFYPSSISAYNAQYGTVADVSNMKIVNDDTGQSKEPVKVAQMPANVTYSFQIRANQNIERKAGFDVFNYINTSDVSYEVCVRAKAVSGTGKVRVQFRYEGVISAQSNKDITASGTYVTRCVLGSGLKEGDRIRLGNVSSVAVNVDRITITKR